MKKIILIISVFLAISLFSGCKEEPATPPWQDGIITGYDFARCACCGGLMIDTSGNTEKYEGEFYRWNRTIEYAFLDEMDFPIYVKFQFELIEDGCEHMRWIEVTELELK